MNQPTPIQDRELVLTRTINVPREKLYRAWTERELLKQWFAPKPWTTPAHLDVRAGGEPRTSLLTTSPFCGSMSYSARYV